MNPVLMDLDQAATPESAYRAALATLLGIQLWDVPEFSGLAAQIEFEAWLAREANMGVFTVQQLADPSPGYWLARVGGGPYGYAIHTLVMRGTTVAHDPHPEQKMAPGGLGADLLQAEMLVPLDPSQPSGAPALG